MKLLILSIVLTLPLSAIMAQDYESTKFDGTWEVQVSQANDTDEETETGYYKISQGKVYAYHISDDGEYYLDNSRFDVVDSNFSRNNLMFFWINSGGLWSETQALSFSLINSDKMKVKKFRHVNNVSEFGDNEEWGYFQEGYAYKIE